MAETTADVRRDIELTRERMSTTLAQLEQKLNVMQVVRDHPWPALALALGAGFALAGSKADVKAAAATVRATGGAANKLGEVLDDLAASVIGGVTTALHSRADALVSEFKQAIGAPAAGTTSGARLSAAAPEADGRSRAADVAVDRADRQVLGMDNAARRGGSDQLLGIDLPAQDSGAVAATGSPRAG